jgi:EAL domain-containing protein (putative c-di-GMP-specific phosphodiesterase class I)
MNPENLEIEITEDSLMKEGAEKTLKYIRDDLHIKIALDDFGSAYSSLGELKRFKGLLDIIKIDKKLIDNVADDKFDAHQVSSIIESARILKAGIVAEGIEKPSQAEFLFNHMVGRENSVNIMMQGYLYYRPLSHGDYEKEISKGGK